VGRVAAYPVTLGSTTSSAAAGWPRSSGRASWSPSRSCCACYAGFARAGRNRLCRWKEV